jgi:hypothetical protein
VRPLPLALPPLAPLALPPPPPPPPPPRAANAHAHAHQTRAAPLLLEAGGELRRRLRGE